MSKSEKKIKIRGITTAKSEKKISKTLIENFEE